MSIVNIKLNMDQVEAFTDELVNVARAYQFACDPVLRTISLAFLERWSRLHNCIDNTYITYIASYQGHSHAAFQCCMH